MLPKTCLRWMPIILLPCLAGCTPKPLEVTIEEAPTKIAVSSLMADRHTAFITATYSANSLQNLNDTSRNNTPAAIDQLLVGHAAVLLHSGGGTDTLNEVSAGLYGSNRLNLVYGQSYDLELTDQQQHTVHAVTTCMPPVTVTSLQPSVRRTETDTVVKLRLSLSDDLSTTDYYLLSYSNVNPATVPSAPGGARFPVFNINATKRLELFTDADAAGGAVHREFTIDAGATDTLYVHIGRIEKGYYEFLTAYKRNGSFFNQLTGEPITLPTNVIPGLGYFSLYEAYRQAFFLKDY